MSVDFYNCGGCDEIESDCAPLHMCVNCGSHVFDCCYNEMVEKFGIIGPSDIRAIEHQYSANDLKCCNSCQGK